MTCRRCEHPGAARDSRTAAGTQRYRCRACGARFSDPKPLNHHRIKPEDAERVFSLLLEGMSVRAASRLTGVHKGTITNLLLTLGEKCDNLLDGFSGHLRPDFVEADELWTFVQKKERRMTEADDPDERGSQFVWLALDPCSRMILCHMVGRRNLDSANRFMGSLRERIAADHRFQLSTDGFRSYVEAVESAFGPLADYGQVDKQYREAKPFPRYVSSVKAIVSGRPRESKISTSLVERVNLTVRQQLRRFTRRGTGFSKTVTHLRAMLAVFVAWYNLCRVHGSLRVTPAMEAGLTDHVWTLRELLTAPVQ